MLAQTTPAPSPTTPPPPTATDMPNRNLNLPTYRPNAQDFLTTLDSIPTNSNALRRTEPPICDRMRTYLNFKLKLFHERLLLDVKRFAATFVTSRSDRLTEAVNDAQTATTTAIDEFAAKAKEFMTTINDSCSKLDSTTTLQEINKRIEELRARQIDNAGKLAAIPAAYEEKMQSLYKPVEAIIGSP